MDEDPVIEKINKRRRKERQKLAEILTRVHGQHIDEFGRKYKSPIKRATGIALNNDLRTPSNNILFKIYKFIRRFHVAIWFYPFPFIVMVTMFNGAFRNSFKQEYTPDFFVPANITEAEVNQVVE